MSKTALKIIGLTKYYGKSVGIKDINLEIEKGIIYGFIGPNGAGKSTTIKCIMNLINKNSGKIKIDDEIDEKSNYKINKDIGYLPAELHLYGDLKAKELLSYSASFYKKDCTKKTNKLVDELNIDLNKKIDQLSFGNVKKVGIVLALMHNPQIIIMDEATSGLDPLMQEKFYNILKEEKKKGHTIFFSSHILNEVKKICDKVAIIKDGKIVDFEDVFNINKSNMLKISLQSKDIQKIIKELDFDIKSIEGNKVEFMYKDDINNLLFLLSNYKVSKLLISEPNIEEIFMHYYE